MDPITNIDQFFARTDWAELRRQKDTLINVQAFVGDPGSLPASALDEINEHGHEHLEGILNFLDALQDLAADHYEQPAYEVKP